jgi:DNA topoisomerase-1
VSVRGGRIHFHFLGKSGKVHDIDLHDRRLSLLVKRLQDLPGQDLFQFLDDDGKQQGVSSEDINAYVREAAGDEFSAKDFRTWWGTTLAALAFCAACRDAAAPPTKRRMKDVIVQVAGRLGNTPTICRKSYIHPAVLDGYLGGRTLELASPSTAVANGVAVHRVGRGLSPEEKAVLRFLRAQRRRRAPSLTEALEKSIGK